MQDLNFDKGKIAIVLAGVLCLYAVYGAVADFRLPDRAQAVEPPQSIIELDPVKINSLVKTHLFGKPPAPPKLDTGSGQGSDKNEEIEIAQKKKEVDTKPIQISVTVTGLLASADNNFAAAIMKVDNKPERMYKVGEDLGKAQVILQSVGNENVVIDNNGNEQFFALNRPGLESGGSTSSRGGASFQQNQDNPDLEYLDNGLPPLPPELELPDDEFLDASGAYSPEPPESEYDLEPALSQEELQDQQMMEEMAREMEGHDGGHDGNYEEELPPLPEEENSAGSPNFQMPVF